MYMYMWCRTFFRNGGLKIFIGDAGAEARKYRQHCLDLFMPARVIGTKRNRVERQKRGIMETWANGDWRVEGEVQHYVTDVGIYQENPDAYRTACMGAFTRGVVWCLYGRNPRVFQRKEWNGGYKAVCDLALPVAFHGLGTMAYKALMQSKATPPNPAMSQPALVVHICVYGLICIKRFIYLYIYIYRYIYMHVCTYAFIFIYECICAYLNVYVYVYIHIYI